MSRRDAAERGYSLTMIGLTAVLGGLTLLALSFVASQSVTTGTDCRSPSGNGGNSGGTAGILGRDYPPPPAASPGRCTGRVNDYYVESSNEEFGRAMVAAKDHVYRRTARAEFYGSLVLMVAGVVLIRAGRKRVETQVPDRPVDAL
jgi:hypothetical protein